MAEWQGEMVPGLHWTDGEPEARRRNKTDSSRNCIVGYAGAGAKRNVYFLTGVAWPPLGDGRAGASAACRPSYLVVLCPAVLDQVPHVVELAGVTPAPWWRLPE